MDYCISIEAAETTTSYSLEAMTKAEYKNAFEDAKLQVSGKDTATYNEVRSAIEANHDVTVGKFIAIYARANYGQWKKSLEDLKKCAWVDFPTR